MNMLWFFVVSAIEAKQLLNVILFNKCNIIGIGYSLMEQWPSS